ncbi:hypothetical protein [Pyramidobacter piscolens]|uniref:hypothetical protein n=1 Tax=Pyramidobacter piscolens TaxID=638849 RepID=UPI001FCA9171|nr:hypothetical protein [Pyramidobacter piscolens]
MMYHSLFCFGKNKLERIQCSRKRHENPVGNNFLIFLYQGLSEYNLSGMINLQQRATDRTLEGGSMHGDSFFDEKC